MRAAAPGVSVMVSSDGAAWVSGIGPFSRQGWWP